MYMFQRTLRNVGFGFCIDKESGRKGEDDETLKCIICMDMCERPVTVGLNCRNNVVVRHIGIFLPLLTSNLLQQYAL